MMRLGPTTSNTIHAGMLLSIQTDSAGRAWSIARDYYPQKISTFVEEEDARVIDAARPPVRRNLLVGLLPDCQPSVRRRPDNEVITRGAAPDYWFFLVGLGLRVLMYL
jgi:hypothetical protein